MTQTVPTDTPQSASPPNFRPLVQFLLKPFLEETDSISLDSEVLTSKRRIIVRIAVEGESKSRVYGRGGRNIQAIRTVLQTLAQLSDYSAHLEFFGGDPNAEPDSSGGYRSERSYGGGDRRPPRRSNGGGGRREGGGDRGGYRRDSREGDSDRRPSRR